MLLLETESGNKLVRLSQRECDVLRVLTSGASNKEIAAALNIAESTARDYVADLCGDLRMRRIQLVTWAVAHPQAILGMAVDPTYTPPFALLAA